MLSCADSRVPPELVFNTGLGELFVVRSAGEVLDRSILASLEYGAEHLKSPLLVVMGHEFCGAVKAAKERKPGVSMGPNLDFLLKQIQPAVARADKAIFDEPLRAAVLANVELIVADLQVQSPILHTLVERGKLQIVGAFYELSTGRVSFSNVVAGRPGPAQTRRAPAGGHPAPNVVTVRPQPVARRPPRPAAALTLLAAASPARPRAAAVQLRVGARRRPPQWISSRYAISRSSPTSTTASRRWPTASSRRPAPCRPASSRPSSSTAWTSSASAASPSRRTPCASTTRRRTARPTSST